MNSFDSSSHDKFYEYYAQASQTPETLGRFRALRDTILRVGDVKGLPKGKLEVVDVGCGAGTQSLVWAELGHNVHGVDINQPLLELARQRAQTQGYQIDFRLGSSTEMPWANGSIDVCIVLELLEHVTEWQACIKECARIVRTGGILFITTTNKLCPLQNEFNLPVYSWYPDRVKRHFENLAVTTRPDLANYATYPAVNWFTFYSLRDALASYGFSCMDRFEVMDTGTKALPLQLAVAVIKKVPVLKWLAQIASQGSLVLALKEREL
jgi:2-polyprenyl-6-hydroxyphenyl methylase/3-demethylubiquinone-9 3-methyltransferase